MTGWCRPLPRAAGRAIAAAILCALLATPVGTGAQGDDASAPLPSAWPSAPVAAPGASEFGGDASDAPAGALTATASDLDAVSPAAVAAIARDLNCPVCEGYNLEDCPLPLCAQMRDLIRERLAGGETRTEIVAAFVADYGPQVLNAPPATGFFLAAWIMPVVVFALGILGVAALFRRRPDPPEVAPTDGAADVERLERLERMVLEDDR